MSCVFSFVLLSCLFCVNVNVYVVMNDVGGIWYSVVVVGMSRML